MQIDPGELDTLANIERPVADDAFDGAGSGTWASVDTDVWIGLRDMLPTRDEKTQSGMTVQSRRARVRMRWRADVDETMRFVVDGRDPLHIIAGPAVIGRRQWLEFMVEEYRPAGNAA